MKRYYAGFFAEAAHHLPTAWRRGRVVEGTSLLRKHMGLNLYRGFESLRLRQNTNARFCGRFYFVIHILFAQQTRTRRRVSRLRGLREGFEGNRLQAIQRPAERRRIPPSPPEYKRPLLRAFVFCNPFFVCTANPYLEMSKPPARIFYEDRPPRLNNLSHAGTPRHPPSSISHFFRISMFSFS